MINSREIIFNSVRNIGFKDGKPVDEKLILNHSVRTGENGDLLILIGANNSGKSNILDGILWNKYIKEDYRGYIEYCQGEIGNYQRDIENRQMEIEDYQRKIEDCQRDIEDYQMEIEDYQRDIEDCQRDIEDYQWNIEDYQRNIEDYQWNIEGYRNEIQNCQRKIENYQREIENYRNEIQNCQREVIEKICREFTTNLYSDEVCRKPNVSFHFTNLKLSLPAKPDCYNANEARKIKSSEFEILASEIENSEFFTALLRAIEMPKEDVINAYDNLKKDNQKTRLNELEEKINDKLESISKIFNQFYVTDVPYSFKIELERKNILFLIYRGNDVMVLDNQSVGFRYFFDLFIYLHSCSLKPGDIIVMDEPATNLHISAQKELRVFLKEIARCWDITIVLATHSPFLIDLNHLDELRIIENKDNIVRIHNTFTAVNYGDPDSLLPIKEALTVENHILVNPKKTVVFVEGITDYNYLTAFKLLFKNEDIIFVPINGVGADENHCKEISKRLLKIRKDAIVLVDNDTAGKRMKEINDKDSDLKVVSLDEIDKNFKEIESLFSKTDLEKSELIDDSGDFSKHASTSAVFKKRLANDSSYITDETRNNFEKLFNYLTEKTS